MAEKNRQQIPEELCNYVWLFPGRALLKIRPGFYVIIWNDTRKKNQVNQGNGK